MTQAVVVGSGPNGLAAALTLAEAGLGVRVLEAARTLGGGTRSSELTLPGVIHDECSAAHPLALDTPFSRTFDLTAHGVTWLRPPVQYAHPLDGGRGAAAVRSVERTAQHLGEDGGRWRAIFNPLVAQFDAIGEEIVRPVVHRPRHPMAMARFGGRSVLPVAMLGRAFATDVGRAMFAGVAAHALRPFSSPMSSAIGVTLGAAAHRYGWPVAEGGSQAICDAMVKMAKARGVTFETGVAVTSVTDLGGADVVMLDTSPSATADIVGDRLSRHVCRALRGYRHGPGAFKVDFAVQDGVPWAHEPSRRAGTVHVGGTFEEIAASERATCSGRMPDNPYVLVCQQSVADPSRRSGDIHPVYAYAHVPHGWPGDATEQIARQIERFAPGFRDRVLATHVRSTSAMTNHNANYVGGDIVTGSNDPLQMIFRPRIALDPYTIANGIYICSAATPPGAGAHGMCGFNAANAALRRLGLPPIAAAVDRAAPVAPPHYRGGW